MSVDRPVLERLGFARFLYDESVRQARAPEPTRSAALLTLHDSLDLFLQIGRSAKGTSRSGREFLQLFDGLADAVVGLEGRALLERVNQARVALKHHGVQPSAKQVTEFVAEAGGFLRTNSSLIFSVSFDAISLAHLVSEQKVREALEEAEQKLAQQDTDGAVFFLSTAWSELMWAFEKTRVHQYPLFKDPLGESSSLAEPFATTGSKDTWLSEYLASLDTRLRWLARAVMIQSLNLDFEAFRRFERVASWLHRDDEGEIVAVSGRGSLALFGRGGPLSLQLRHRRGSTDSVSYVSRAVGSILDRDGAARATRTDDPSRSSQ